MTFSLSAFHGIFSTPQTSIAVGKPAFASLPQRICADLCTLVGASSIVAGDVIAGGVSASASFIVTFDNQRRVFVKGSHPGDQSHGAANLRGECMAYRALDILRDVAPPFCGMVYADRGDDNGWWLGAWDAVEISTQPYDGDQLFALLDDVQRCDVNARDGIVVASAHPYLSQFLNDTYKWQRLRDDASRADKFAQCFADPAAVQGWLRGNIAALCDLQKRASTHSWRFGLMHGDLRCDNFIYGQLSGMSPRWYMIDWANAAEGALAFDRVMLAASLCADGACTREHALDFARGDLDGDDIVLMLAMQAGYFADQIYRQPPAVMPRLRPIQKAMCGALLAMLATTGQISPLPVAPQI